MKEEMSELVDYKELIELLHALMYVVQNNTDAGVIYKAQCKLWGLMELIEVPDVPKELTNTNITAENLQKVE